MPFGEDTASISDLDLEIVRGDVRDINSVFQAVKDADVVLHLAGIISISAGQKKAARRG